METALLKGDRVLVNRTSYGIRMPVTILSIPFTFDSFLGMQSYSSLINLGYHRLFGSEVESNDVVVFNNPMQREKPLDKRSLCISRCVAVSGDTVVVDGYNYLINGKRYVTSPDFLLRYKFQKDYADTIKNIIAVLDIPLRNFSVKKDFAYTSFNRYEAFLINQNLPDSLKIDLAEKEVSSYNIIIPKKGMKIKIDAINLPVYRSIFEQECGDKLRIANNRIFVGGVEMPIYTFQYNYYWFLSDNVDESVDSRYVGFISEQDIIGKASFIWYSSDDDSGIRWDRIFTQVK